MLRLKGFAELFSKSKIFFLISLYSRFILVGISEGAEMLSSSLVNVVVLIEFLGNVIVNRLSYLCKGYFKY